MPQQHRIYQRMAYNRPPQPSISISQFHKRFNSTNLFQRILYKYVCEFHPPSHPNSLALSTIQIGLTRKTFFSYFNPPYIYTLTYFQSNMDWHRNSEFRVATQQFIKWFSRVLVPKLVYDGYICEWLYRCIYFEFYETRKRVNILLNWVTTKVYFPQNVFIFDLRWKLTVYF